MTDLQDYFIHGSEYINNLDEPRDKCCNSCALTNCRDTVRPKDVTIEQLEKFTADLDVFYCHTESADGKNRICAQWWRLVEGNLDGLRRSEQEIADILNKEVC